MPYKYISIKTVLYSLSQLIDAKYWNEAKILEWAVQGFRQLNITASLMDKVESAAVANHKFKLPLDFKYLTQISDVTVSVDGTVCPTPMRLTSNPYHTSICCPTTITYCTNCLHEYSVNELLIATTTLKEGTVMIAYKAYPTNNGDFLIPDDDVIKQALLYYVLYMYWLSKYNMKEDGAEQRVKYFLDMWSTLSKKAHNIDLPSIGQLENIKNQHNSLVPRSNKFDQLFTTLGKSEQLDF